MSHCVLLNADYSFLNVIEWKRAMCMVAKGKVQVLQYSDRMIRCAEGVVFKLPAVLKLIKLIRIVYRNRVPFSKRNVFIRDGFRCAYCGGERVRLTIDHIIPKSRGGGDNVRKLRGLLPSLQHPEGRPHTVGGQNVSQGQGVSTDDFRVSENESHKARH